MKKYLSVIMAVSLLALSSAVMMPAVSETAVIEAAETSSTISESLKLTSNKVFDGDLIIAGGTVDLNGFKLTVKGSLYQPGGEMIVGTGALNAAENYYISKSDKSCGSGILDMSHAEGTVTVGKDFCFYSEKDSNYILDGTLSVGGNFSAYRKTDGDTGGFNTRYNHTTVFTGGSGHIIDLNSHSYNHLYKIQMTAGDTIEFKNAVNGLSNVNLITVSPVKLAEVSGKTVKAVSEGTGEITFSNGSSKMTCSFTVNKSDPVTPIKPVVMGDVNYDGEFSAADLIMMKKWMLGMQDAELINSWAGDFTEDGKLNIADFCLMKEALLGIS